MSSHFLTSCFSCFENLLLFRLPAAAHVAETTEGSSPVLERFGTASLELSKVSEMTRSSRTLINEQNMLLAAAGSPSPHEGVSSLIISGWSKRAGFKLAAALRPSGFHHEVSSWCRESVGPGSPGCSPPSRGGPIKVH